ncbi:hypothetical protein GOP47_0023959 [Adiantum capillus-veneris]|uniref:Uncharacterized protein n=1 Tax=Adiantum capillus-veneris TaxID=13818 RepID=A0A9D4U6N4_ADICA|nr:hypothetical protein GOP47_0023959 [Adiantum capillus-veneris]
MELGLVISSFIDEPLIPFYIANLNMGDASLEAPAFQLLQAKQAADASVGDCTKGNLEEDCVSSVEKEDPSEVLSFKHAADTPVGDVTKSNSEEDYASSVKKEGPSEVLSSAINFQRIEEDEPSSNKDHLQMQVEADQIDVAGVNGKVILYNDNEKSRENLEECEHQIVDSPKEPASVLPLQSSSSISESPIRDDRSIHLTDKSQAISNELKVDSESANGDENLLSKILIDGEKTGGFNVEEKRDGLGGELEKELESMDESYTGSTSPCIVSSIPKGILSTDVSQPFPLLPVSDTVQQQSQSTSKLAGDGEISRSTAKGEVNVGSQNDLDPFRDPSNQEWSDLDFGEATLISTDIEGWHRFDPEEINTAQGDPGDARWEQLLDDGLESIGKHHVITPLQLGLPLAYRESQPELVSPGNPFIEEHERLSNFSEADGLQYIDRLSQEPSPLRLKGGLVDDRAHCDPSSGVATSTEGEKNASKSSAANETKTKSHLLSSSSLDFMEPFEAPSFMSLVDPKSHALFEACMPKYQPKDSGYGHESGEEQWVADFDLVAPSTQEITRSISMPRSGSDSPGQRPGQSVSFTVNREEEPSRKENESPSIHRTISGFLSPKVSPLVQKVVDKVRSTPAAANGVINSVRQAMSPKASGKKSTSGSLLTRCMCW